MSRSVMLLLIGSIGAQVALAARTNLIEHAALWDDAEALSETGMCPADLPDLPEISEDIEKACSSAHFGTLMVGCVSASDMKKKRFWRDNRAVCRVELVSKTHFREAAGRKYQRVSTMFQTPVSHGQDPEWKASYHFDFACVEAADELKDYMLQVQVKDARSETWLTHLGYSYVDMTKFKDFTELSVEDYELVGNRAEDSGHRTGSSEGTIKLALKWCPHGDQKCLASAEEQEGLKYAGTEWRDCNNGCHNALVAGLHPIYKDARHKMATAVKAGKDEEKFDDIEDDFEDKAEELDHWLEENDIPEPMKHFVRPGPPPCPPGHGGPEEPPCPGPRELTPEEHQALHWQAQKRARDENERQHEIFKKKEAEAKDKAKKTFEQGKDAMETIGSRMVDGSRSACGDLVVPFIQSAGDKITKMPDGKFKIDKAEEAVRQLDEVWKSINDFQLCLKDKWKNGRLLPSRSVQTTDEECYESIKE